MTQVVWNAKLQRTAGYCKMSTSLGGRRDARIDLSSKVIDNVDRLRDTLAHEMCHAAQWLLDGSAKPPHGARFKYWAKKFEGAVAGVGITTCHSYEIHYKYRYRCDGRAEMPPRSRRGRHVSHARLRVTGARTSLGGSRSRSTWTDSGARGAMGRSRCSVRRDAVTCLKRHCILHHTPRFIARSLPSSGGFTREGTPLKAREPSAFAKYVKDQFPKLKKARADLGCIKKHANQFT